MRFSSQSIIIKSSVLIIGLICFMVFYAHIETRWIKTNHIIITDKDIPPSFENFNIVFISDIHHGPLFSIERVIKLVNKINRLNPEIIILGGDYVHRDAKYIKPVFKELRKLRSQSGVFAVLGNHDHWEDADLTKEMIHESSFYLCDNSSNWLKKGNDRIKIGGVGDLWEAEQIPDNTINDLKTDDFCILISHNPDYIEKLNTDKVDLTLSGHTHGGQITFLGLWAPVLPSKYGQKYRYGIKHFKNFKSYITSGIGTISPSVRFFCRPEIVVIKLKSK